MSLITDSPHHFWDTTKPDFDYYWMTDDLAVIRGVRGPEQLRPWLEAKGVDRTVVVQTIPSLRETELLLETAALTDFVAGVVGGVDLTDAAVGDTIAALQARTHGRDRVSIRHQEND